MGIKKFMVLIGIILIVSFLFAFSFVGKYNKYQALVNDANNLKVEFSKNDSNIISSKEISTLQTLVDTKKKELDSKIELLQKQADSLKIKYNTFNSKDYYSYIDTLQKAINNSDNRFISVSKEERALRIPVLMYHDVTPDTVSYDNNIMPHDVFTKQMQYLKDNGFTTITMKEFIDAYEFKINLPKKSVLLTFDDGFNTIKDVVEPILEPLGFKATSFVIGGFMDRERHMNLEAIRDLQTRNTINFSSHTYNFHDPGKNSKGRIETATTEEAILDNNKMNEILGFENKALCYPFGHFGLNALDNLNASGLKYGFAIQSGSSTWVYLNEEHKTSNNEIQNPLALPRVRINGNIDIEEFIRLVNEN